MTATAPTPIWAEPAEDVVRRLATADAGLTSAEAAARLARHGPNVLRDRSELTRWRIIVQQVKSPLMLLLVFAAIASAVTGAWTEATIVVVIVTASVWIGTSREHSAARAIAALRRRITIRTRVIRDGASQLVPARELVPGDVVELAAGSIVPADLRL